ncbi:MAG: hypothetical protein ACI4LO_06455 [Anaerovoracaceae bacterium]
MVNKFIKNGIIVFLVAIIICLLVYIGNLRSESENYIGTYQKGEYYIVLDRDGNYLKYEQFNILDEGKYEILQDGIIEITRKNGEIMQLIRISKGLISYEEESMCIYKNISNNPLYINIENT